MMEATTQSNVSMMEEIVSFLNTHTVMSTTLKISRTRNAKDRSTTLLPVDLTEVIARSLISTIQAAKSNILIGSEMVLVVVENTILLNVDLTEATAMSLTDYIQTVLLSVPLLLEMVLVI